MFVILRGTPMAPRTIYPMKMKKKTLWIIIALLLAASAATVYFFSPANTPATSGAGERRSLEGKGRPVLVVAATVQRASAPCNHLC
jgi:hypothetical protein